MENRTDYKVIDAMTLNPVRTGPDTTVSDCAAIMKNSNVGSVLVFEGNKLLGIITEWDITRKIVAEDKNPKETVVSQVMTTNVTSINPSSNLFEAITLMAQLDIKHLPVMDNGEFMGFLTSNDILKIEPALFEILLDEIELRESDRKPLLSYEDADAGQGLDYTTPEEDE